MTDAPPTADWQSLGNPCSVFVAPVVVGLHLLTTADPTAFEPYAIRLLATSLLVLTGVTLAWPTASAVSDGPEPSSRAGPS